MGFSAGAGGSPEETAYGSEVGSAISPSKVPFLSAGTAGGFHHLNLCGANTAEHAEAGPEAVAGFQTVVVDDLQQAKVEAGDLVQAERAGTFTWEHAVELKDIVSGRVKPVGRTLFKSVGVALEDAAIASLVYDCALKDKRYAERSVDLKG